MLGAGFGSFNIGSDSDDQKYPCLMYRFTASQELTFERMCYDLSEELQNSHVEHGGAAVERYSGYRKA